MTIFFILSMAFNAARALFLSECPRKRPSCLGMICHERPYLSLSQPHCSAAGTAERLSKYRSTSCCVSQFTRNEMASLKAKFCCRALSTSRKPLVFKHEIPEHLRAFLLRLHVFRIRGNSSSL